MKMAFLRDAGPMNIGRAAATAGMSARMVRYYEGVGLIPRAGRSAAGYRRYGPEEVQRLRFIKRSRELGFSVERIGELLALWQDGNRASADVKRLALAHVAELNGRIRELEAMRDQLQRLAERCHGDATPDCPIIEAIAHERRPP